jgi:hypothetical protein
MGTMLPLFFLFNPFPFNLTKHNITFRNLKKPQFGNSSKPYPTKLNPSLSFKYYHPHKVFVITFSKTIPRKKHSDRFPFFCNFDIQNSPQSKLQQLYFVAFFPKT